MKKEKNTRIKLFKKNIKKTDYCWIWQGTTDKDGYGKFSSDWLRAHRFSWELHNNKKIPKGMFVLHSCDNPPCVNPEHLSLGTHKDNMRDAKRKGRKYVKDFIGSDNNNAKLKEKQVKKIKNMIKNKIKDAEIAKEYNVTPGCIATIRRGERWQHVKI